MADDCQNLSSPDEASQLDSLASANAQELLDEETANNKRKNRRPGSFWKKPISRIYADNFGFGVNGYQCMIDYLDTKQDGGRPKKSDIHLPFLEDRCLDSYSSRKPFKFYDNDDIDKYIETGGRIRDQIRQNDIAQPGNCLHRTHTNWSMTKKYVQLVKKSNVIDYRKLREEAEREARGIIVPKAFKTVGVSFALASMDPMNLTLMQAHNNLDHAIYMTSRRERLSGLDDQMDCVVSQLADGTGDLNRRACQEVGGRNRSRMITPYDNVQSLGELAMVTEDLAARNRLRRQLEFQAIEENIDDVMRYDRSRNRIRNNLRHLNDHIVNIEDSVSVMRRRHREERGEDSEIPVHVLSSLAKKKARKMLNLDVADEDVDDPELARLKMRRAHKYEPLDDPAVTPFHKYRSRPDVVSDVQSRVMQRAGEIAGQTSTHRHVNNRARFVNIYVPRHNTADPDLIVKPTRTELNIDYMAKTLAAKGRIQRRFDVDEEGDLPVSGLNTYARSQYCDGRAFKPIDVVPSNSLRVRSAIIRARQRNALQGR